MTPKTLEVIVRTGRFSEDMDDEVSIIHQDPLRSVIPFDTYWKLAYAFQLLADFIRDRLALSRICDRAQDEEVRKRRHFPEIQHL